MLLTLSRFNATDLSSHVLFCFDCQQTTEPPILYANSGRCNGTDSPTTVIVSPGDHIHVKDEYLLQPDDEYIPTHSPNVLSDE